MQNKTKKTEKKGEMEMFFMLGQFSKIYCISQLACNTATHAAYVQTSSVHFSQRLKSNLLHCMAWTQNP